MNRFKLYRLLRKNTTLSYKRSPVFEQNKWAKGLTYFGAGLLALYMIMYGCLIAMTAEGEAGRMISLMPIILAIDFLFRFVIQTTPGMMVKPYILLPISRYSAIECFLLSSHLSGYNFLWLCMFVPYSIILIFAGAGFWPVVLELICCVLLIILNSQVYLFFRTLINRKVVWFLAAVAVYSIPFLPWILKLDRKGFERMIDMYAEAGRAWWFLLAVIIAITLLFFVNRHFQFKYVYEEISKKKERALRHVSQFAFLNRFGLVGEYLKIELKSNLRNKTMRSRCIMSIALIVMFSMLVAYTPIYDNLFMQNFWCLYCFAIYSVTTLIKIMGQEGNYIDLLMMHRENIIALLEAKFWFYSAVLFIPFLVMLPAVFTGKFTLLMLVAYMLLTAGLLHFVIFQLAVYNKQTLPLQQKITAKGNFENGMQLVIELLSLFAPGAIAALGFMLVGPTYTFIAMSAIGLLFISTHPIWIRNIYNRMMKRRYENIDGFHATRQ